MPYVNPAGWHLMRTGIIRSTTKGEVGSRRRREAICKPPCLASDKDRYYMKHHKEEGREEEKEGCYM